MGKEALHELIDKVDESEVKIIYFVLSRLIASVDDEVEEELLPDEIEAFKEFEEAKARGDKFRSHSEVWGDKFKTKVA